MSKRNDDGPDARTFSGPRAEGCNEPNTQQTFTPFAYEKLDHGTDSIRVLEVLPGPVRSKIRCTMRHTNISSAEYACLSYTWQPSHPQHEVEINGHQCTVGENLYQFLNAYRMFMADDAQEKHYKKIWIDALCINQNDVPEKNHQVSQMGKVYQGSAQVLIWLGILAYDTLNFIEDMNLHGEKLDEIMEHEDDFDSRKAAFLSKNDLPKDLWSEQYQLFWALPYWQRAWIVQEIMLPGKNTSLYILARSCWGRTCLFDFMRTSSCMFAMMHVLSTDTFEDPPYANYDRLREGRLEGNTAGAIPSLLDNFAYCGCFDKRDRIYSLLSLANSKPNIVVDYQTDRITLVRTVLGQFFEHLALDQLLLFGAGLVQALDIHPTATDEQDTKLYRKLTRPKGVAVGLPIWTRAVLEYGIQDMLVEEIVSCVSIGIFDGRDVHVFEYVVEERGSNTVVTYARLHEYLQGVPQMALKHDTVPDAKDGKYFWFNRPSEDVHYFRGPIGERIENKNKERELTAWFSLPFRLSKATAECRMYEKHRSEFRPRIRAAERSWMHRMLFSTSQRLLGFDTFPSSSTDLSSAVKQGLLREGSPESPWSSRCTTLYLSEDLSLPFGRGSK